jgi:hypothetical protein
MTTWTPNPIAGLSKKVTLLKTNSQIPKKHPKILLPTTLPSTGASTRAKTTSSIDTNKMELSYTIATQGWWGSIINRGNKLPAMEEIQFPEDWLNDNFMEREPKSNDFTEHGTMDKQRKHCLKIYQTITDQSSHSMNIP